MCTEVSRSIFVSNAGPSWWLTRAITLPPKVFNFCLLLVMYRKSHIIPSVRIKKSTSFPHTRTHPMVTYGNLQSIVCSPEFQRPLFVCSLHYIIMVSHATKNIYVHYFGFHCIHTLHVHVLFCVLSYIFLYYLYTYFLNMYPEIFSRMFLVIWKHIVSCFENKAILWCIRLATEYVLKISCSYILWNN